MGVKVVFTAGSVLRGDDALGPFLAKMLEESPIDGWTVVDGAQTPEDDVGAICRMEPDRVILIDAASMGKPVGTICALSRDDILTDYLMTTHSLPLTMVMDKLDECCADVTFVGVQISGTDLLAPLHPKVMESVEALYRWIADGADPVALPVSGGAAAREAGAAASPERSDHGR